MAGQHTPGPWSHHVDIACKCGYVSASDHPVAKVISGDWGDDYPSIRLVGGSLERVAEAYMDQITYGRIDQAEADANARLIAAAPELLDALRAADEALVQFTAFESDARAIMGNTNFALVLLRQTQVRAAIAKATGADQ